MPLSVTLSMGHPDIAHASPADAEGNAGALNLVPPAWASSNTGVVTVAASANGQSATLTPVATGEANITIAGQNSDGAPVNGVFIAFVINPATQFIITFDPPQ